MLCFIDPSGGGIVSFFNDNYVSRFYAFASSVAATCTAAGATPPVVGLVNIKNGTQKYNPTKDKPN